MAGAFGAMGTTYDLSLKVAEPLIAQLRGLPETTQIVASGTSCRNQIAHLHQKTPLHIAEALANSIEVPAS